MRFFVDFSKIAGPIKPMHAVNNGPVVRLTDVENGTQHPFNSNLAEYKAAGLPYARTHDSSFYHRYGLEHTIDVMYLFPDFDADPEDPASYDFACTDHYLAGMALAGTEVFYRLGHRIEHEVKKYGTLPPRDFHKWAIICEHIVRHYTEGWADGYRYSMPYWEIWGEPDLDADKPAEKRPLWGGTKEQYFELYHVAATHLKRCFPHLKIGGPSLAFDFDWAEDFLAQLKAPLDFFSWHCYGNSPEKMVENGRRVRAMLDRYGFAETENILNEWNFLVGWSGDDIVYSHEHLRGIRGAAFSAAAMAACQDSPIDMLMYYDARPNEFWNGIFDERVVGRTLKGYWPFYAFNHLYRLGGWVKAEGGGEDCYLCAARSDTEAAVLLTHYKQAGGVEDKTFTVDLSGFGTESGTEVEWYVLDEGHDLSLMAKAVYFGDRFVSELVLPNFTSYLIRFKKH